VSLSGTGTAPPIVSLSPYNLSFGSITVGSSSDPQTVTVTNTGTTALTLGRSAIALSGTNPSDYSQTNNCGWQIAAGASCTINVTFKPKSSGSRPASVTITSNAKNSPQTANLNGSGK